MSDNFIELFFFCVCFLLGLSERNPIEEANMVIIARIGS